MSTPDRAPFDALQEATTALREVRQYVRAEAPHTPTEAELARVILLCEDALAKPAKTSEVQNGTNS